MAAVTAIATRPPQPQTHIVFFPSPGIGHLIPLAQFAKRLIPHGFTFTFAVPTGGPPSDAVKSFLAAASADTNNAIESVYLPPVDLSKLPPTTRVETRICTMMEGSIPSLRSLLSDLTDNPTRGRVAAVFADLFGTNAVDVAHDLNLPIYLFFSSTSLVLSFMAGFEKIDEKYSCELRDIPDPIINPGCVPLRGSDLLEPLQDRQNDNYKWILHHCKRFKLFDGIIENSFEALEGGAIKALSEPGPGKPPFYPIGPLVHTPTEEAVLGDPNGVLKWLDDQPAGSVLYISFGSGGSLTSKQQNELALGIEASGVRFLWVVRNPSDSVNATYFSVDGQKNPLGYLPEGFVERTKGRGLAVPTWAPQMKVLTHPATGGIVSHCGWNSTLESLLNGVPMIAWPLYAEQRMNSVLLVEDVKVALRPVAGEDGFVGKEEIARVAKELIEGEEGKKARNKMMELKEAAAKELSEEGNSNRVLKELALKWKSA